MWQAPINQVGLNVYYDKGTLVIEYVGNTAAPYSDVDRYRIDNNDDVHLIIRPYFGK